MFRLIAVALIGLGVFIGVTYSDEIKDLISGDPVDNAKEQLIDGAEDLADKAGDLAGEVADKFN